jgi:S1-C subfamily serine protease
VVKVLKFSTEKFLRVAEAARRLMKAMLYTGALSACALTTVRAQQTSPAPAPTPQQNVRPAPTTTTRKPPRSTPLAPITPPTAPAITSDTHSVTAAPTLLPAPPVSVKMPRPPQVRTPAALTAPRAPVAPREVITVVHRLSGWKLLSLLTSKASSRVVGVDDLSFSTDVHTNIVAGYVSSDGRTIIACLPQAEVEAEAASGPSKLLEGFPAMQGDSELVVVRGDGAQFKATFVGLDGSTGLSFLELSEPIQPPAPQPLTPKLAEGQRVLLYAPEPLAPVAVENPTPPASDVAVGETGVIYAGMGAVEGQLTEIKRAASGKVIEASVRSKQLSPEWTGAIALNEAGALVGILAQNYEDGETRLVPAEAVRGAAARVLARRMSVPQPWLGARGDAVARMSLEKLLSRGWTRARAQSLLNKRLGVMLTSVAPGTPAALAGLRTGDVVARISEREVGGVEDFSFFLKEAGGGSTLNFTILRAAELDPLKLRVQLSGAFNPAGATRDAEARDDEDRARVTETEARLAEASARMNEAEAQNILAKARMEEAKARESGEEQRITEAQKRLVGALDKVAAEQKRVAVAAQRVLAASNLVAQSQKRRAELRTRSGLLDKWQMIEGLDAVSVSSKIAAHFHARSGLLVVSVRHGSEADASGLRPGDVIETVGGQLIPGPHQTFDLTRAARPLTLGVIRGGQKINIQLK